MVEVVESAYGVKVPKLIYGTAWKKERTCDWVRQALTLGFRGLDTACQPKHYHEAGVGEGWAACAAAGLLSRGDLYLQTKFTPLDGHDPQRIPYDPKAGLASQVAQSAAVSLANLKTDHLDALILHSPLANTDDLLTVWRAMEALFTGGNVRQLGISNCYSLPLLELLHQRARVKPALLQNRFYAQTGYDHELRIFCQRHGIIYQSFWTLTANACVLRHPSLLGLVGGRGLTPEQLFLRYLTQIGIVPLTGTTSTAHMRDDLAIFGFSLSAAECAALAALLRPDAG